MNAMEAVAQEGGAPHFETGLTTLARPNSGSSIKNEQDVSESLIPAAAGSIVAMSPERQQSGSFRSQFATALHSHFSRCLNTVQAGKTILALVLLRGFSCACIVMAKFSYEDWK